MSSQTCENVRKKGTNKKKKLSNYNKKLLLKLLKESHCHPKELESMKKRFRVEDENIIKDFVKKQAELSQTKLEQTFRAKSNKHFLNLDECAKNLIENSEQPTDNTLPVTLEAIANLEKLPKPADVCGVDLKTLYQMLAQLSAGFPVDELEDGPTKEFLKQCYSELMDSVPSMEPKSFRDALVEQDKQTQPVYSWLCNSDYSQYLTKIFKDVCSEDDDDDDVDNDDDE